jgi:WD40 repeat protein
MASQGLFSKVLSGLGLKKEPKAPVIPPIQEDEAIIKTLTHYDAVRGVVFSPDGSHLATASYDETVKVWDVESGELLKTLEGHNHWVECVAYSADGKLLASGGRDVTVKIWDAESGECLHTLKGHRDAARTLSFSPMIMTFQGFQ